MTCAECHHLPSGRHVEEGAMCYCRCHDVADHALEMEAALKAISEMHPNYIGVRELLAKLEAKK